MILPFLLLGFLELGLRVGGYGYDPRFFKSVRNESGEEFLINNDSFIYRFLPPELARWPGAFKISSEKPNGVQRIFVFGESAAMGDPQPSIGPAHILEVLLRERFPEGKFEVVNLGTTAINSHVILPIARDVAARGQGDIWIIYMGNNEMVGPFGAASAFGDRAAPRPWIRFVLALRTTRLGQLIQSFQQRQSGASDKAAWGGMQMFLQNQVPPDDPRRATVHDGFHENLRDIVQLGRQSGAKVVMCTVAVNLRDCPPMASLHRSDLVDKDRARFDELFSKAVQLQSEGQVTAAAKCFAEAARIDPQFAELQFHWGQCLLAITNASAALDRFQLARDADALPFRADNKINRIIRSLGQKHEETNLLLCDVESLLANDAPNQVAGDESFFEHVHFNFDGNYRVAKAWADHVAQLLPKDSTRPDVGAWASQDECERAMGLSDWNRRLVVSTVIARLQMPPLSAQFNNAARIDSLERELKSLSELQQPEAAARARDDFRAAVARHPKDTLLWENLAKFSELTGDLQAALDARRKILDLLPHDYDSTLQVGRLLGKLEQHDEAEPLLREAVMRRDSLPGPWFELGRVLAGQGRHRDALDCFERVHQMQPKDVANLIYLARTLSQLNRRSEAVRHYGDVTAIDPGNWQAHLELAEELVKAEQLDEAIKSYQTAVRLNPRHPVMRINLGVVLARRNRLAEAIQQFEEALSLEPGNAIALDYLSQVRARQIQPPQ